MFFVQKVGFLCMKIKTKHISSTKLCPEYKNSLTPIQLRKEEFMKLYKYYVAESESFDKELQAVIREYIVKCDIIDCVDRKEYGAYYYQDEEESVPYGNVDTNEIFSGALWYTSLRSVGDIHLPLKNYYMGEIEFENKKLNIALEEINKKMNAIDKFCFEDI